MGPSSSPTKEVPSAEEEVEGSVALVHGCHTLVQVLELATHAARDQDLHVPHAADDNALL